MKAVNLPEMKRMSHSADPFVEVYFARSAPASNKTNDNDREGTVANNVTTSATATDTGTNTALTHASVIKLAQSIQDEIHVSRTCVQHKTLYPEWQEYSSISPVNCLADRVIHFRLKDSSNLGESSDNHIGEAYLSVEQLLDQQKHKIWCPIISPAYHKAGESESNSGRKKTFMKLHENCSLQVEVQLFYSKKALWQSQIKTLTESVQSNKKQLVKILQQQLSIKKTSTSNKEQKATKLIKKQLRYQQPDDSLNKSLQSIASSSSSTLDISMDSKYKKKRVTNRSIIGLREKRTVASYLNTARDITDSPNKDTNERQLHHPSHFPSYFLEEVTVSRLESRSPRAMLSSKPPSHKTLGNSNKVR